ncbi:c3 and pzp-like alpha-2-macroglobulin domain-containing protein 8 protein [Lasius niger]|uniref:C3 and pzp-like alpha-2-macroglobulin domain-containing protein 8 protein n=1 Tax=Lasius niger TaxID=67767 RepID=A0A0J7KZB0_LASNI|nr:c3 and pzp-like alpha-2-macroglobulin domain-containing protein 8 protein [Lasius niger]
MRIDINQRAMFFTFPALSTEDKLEYHFYPVTAGQIQFRVKAPNDAHIALTTGPQEGDPMYEVFIGGWSNSKSVVRKNRTKPEVLEVETPDILSADEFRGFWIRWNDGTLTVGKEGDSAPLLSYTDPEPFGIGYFGVCTGWGATGDWLIEGRKPLNTPNKLEYKFHAVRSGSVLIDVKAKSNGHIALTDRKGDSSPMYEIMLGGWENQASVIRYDRKQPDKVRVDTPNLLNEHEHKRFSITWLEGLVTVRSGGQSGAVLMEWRDPNPIGVSYVGRKNSIIDPSTTTPSAPLEVRGLDAGSACWCDASGGMVPPDAVEGGNDDGPLFVGRAHHEGALIPGKVKPSHSVCYIAWGGEEHGKSDYQVLCGCSPTWVAVSGGNIPSNALPGGETEDGEPLFVGRVHHEGTVTIGKVQPSHSVCYIPFGGAEVAFPEYEILVGQ